MAFMAVVLSVASCHQRTMLRVRHVDTAMCKPTFSDIVDRSSRAGQKFMGQGRTRTPKNFLHTHTRNWKSLGRSNNFITKGVSAINDDPSTSR